MKQISGYDNYYITEDGKVYNAKTGRYLKVTLRPVGYCAVNLSKNGVYKSFYVHRLVAEAFIPNPEHKPYINHIDENKSNNHISNLEWCTQKENINAGTVIQRRAKACGQPIQCVETGQIFESYAAAGRFINSDKSDIRKVANNPRRTLKGYHWATIDK